MAHADFSARYRDTAGAYDPPPTAVIEAGRNLAGAIDDARAVLMKGPVTPEVITRSVGFMSDSGVSALTVAGEPDTDLSFLSDLPALTDLRIINTGVRALDALAAHRGTLDRLQVELGVFPVDLSPLGFLGLRELYLAKAGRAVVKKAPEALSNASTLEHLVLHSLRLPSLEPLHAHPHLRGLALKLGGATPLDPVASMPALRFFEAWQVRGLADLTPLGASQTLEVLYLRDLRNAGLPDCSAARRLQHVSIHNVPLGAHALANLAAAPKLRQLRITGSPLAPDHVTTLHAHPTLTAAWINQPGEATDKEYRLGLATIDAAPFTAFGAGVMGLPPRGWEGKYDFVE